MRREARSTVWTLAAGAYSTKSHKYRNMDTRKISRSRVIPEECREVPILDVYDDDDESYLPLLDEGWDENDNDDD